MSEQGRPEASQGGPPAPRPAPGKPGIPARWTSSAKSGVGAALSRASHVWFTLSHGIFNEIYYPRLDHACTRDLGLMITDGREFFSEEKRHADSEVTLIAEGVPGFRVVNTCREGRYRIEKEILTDPDRDVVLQRTRFEPLAGRLEDYHLYVLLAPHLDNHGMGNTAWVADYKGRHVLFASRGAYALALACSWPYLKCSAGYVGVSDAWQDVSRNKRMTWEYTEARDGNVALAAELNLQDSRGEFVLGLGFGRDWSEAAQSAVATIQGGFETARAAYVSGWLDWQRSIQPVPGGARRERDLYRISTAVLRTHEDKSFPGAYTASLSIPWGFSKGDEDLGGYHLVWPRDLVQAASGMIAAGAYDDARAVLQYLQATQEADGHWGQNMWLDGTMYWSGVQMDETALPILLVDHLRRDDELGEGGLARYWPMVRDAAAYILRNGPVSPEDRWETDPGYSPFTLSAEIAALLAAADLADFSGEPGLARCLRETADIWNDGIERWIYVGGNDFARQFGVGGYYVRVSGADDPDDPANHVLSPDFLALVRFGLRAPDDPRILNTIRAIDAKLRVDLPFGPAWRRYTGDAYGEHEDGAPYDGTGIGRAWPLMTGERAHYELAAGNRAEAERLLGALEAFANDSGLLPEQLWDAPDIPDRELFYGRPSGSAMPLVWAHAEYLKLRRSIQEGRVFDMPPQTVARYVERAPPPPYALWRFNLKIATMAPGRALRIEALAVFRLHWSVDRWATARDTDSRQSGFGVFCADLDAGLLPPGGEIVFTFYWLEADRWEGRDFRITIA